MTWVDGEIVTAAKMNAWMPTNATNSYTYLIRKNGSNYEAYSPGGLLVYGGSIDAGGVDGADAAAVIQAVFNVAPDSVFFAGAIYDLWNQTLTCASPVTLFGEGNNKTIFKDGTINITEGTWTDTGTVIEDLDFEIAGNRVALHFTKAINGYVQRVKFHKTSYAPDVPSLWLTSCDCFRIEDNWFDFYQMQIIKIDGNASKSGLPAHIIERNDFGSTAIAFPAYTNPWEVAAIYIADATQKGTFIKDNFGYLNLENAFVYSVAQETWVVGNNVAAGKLKYTVDLEGTSNVIQGNYILAADGSLGAIRFKGAFNDRNSITNNQLYMGVNVTALTGTLLHSIISDNIIYFSELGLDLIDSVWNVIVGNRFVKSVAGTYLAIKESGTSNYNLITNNSFDIGMGITRGANSVYNHNHGYWTETSGYSTIVAPATTVVVTHGLAGTPTTVTVTPRGTGYGEFGVTPRDANTFTITITVGGGSYVFDWTAEYKP